MAETNRTGSRIQVTLWLSEEEITTLLLLLGDRPYLREYVALVSREAGAMTAALLNREG
jgi:hypothetical protein